MFLRRRGGEIALVKSELLDGLEEFEGLFLNKQRKTLAKDLLKVRAHSCFVFSDLFHLYLSVSSARRGVRLRTYD